MATLYQHAGIADARRGGARIQAVVSPPVDVAPPGHRVAVVWAPVAGATKAEVTQATLTLLPGVAEELHADVGATPHGAGWSVDVPAGRRVRAIGLNGFKQPGAGEITSAVPADRRIAIAFPPPRGGGFDAPRFAVPPVFPQGAVPATLTGASLSNRVVELAPSVKASRVRLALVSGGTPSEFADQVTELHSVNLTTHTAARNLTVTGPDGAVLYSTPELDPDGPNAEVDLRVPLSIALTSALERAQALDVGVVVAADAPARVGVRLSRPRGALVRTEAGARRVVLGGDPVELALDGPLAAEAPASVVGDLQVRYAGVRILESASDQLPPPERAVRGVVVASPAVRALPSQALLGMVPARVGLYGRAAEPCELAVEFVEVAGDTVGAVLSQPAVVTVQPDRSLRTIWFEVAGGAVLGQGVGVRVRANKGRFLWVFNEDDAPIVRIAIADPDPGGRAVFMGSTVVARMSESQLDVPAFLFPPAAFRSVAPVVRSDLFVTVTCADLALRYAR